MKDALSGLEHPADARPGDQIEHFGVPGYHMTVQASAPCEQSGSRSGPHSRYKVTDPAGGADWVCGWDVRKVTPLNAPRPGETPGSGPGSPQPKEPS